MSAKSSRPYSRCYYVDLERDYPAVYHDDHLFSTYMRLLNVAEATWPALPEIPRSARIAYVEALVRATNIHDPDGTGLIVRCDTFHYRIKGLDRERTARSDAARHAIGIRWSNTERRTEGNTDGTTEAIPNRTEPNQTEIPPPPTRGGRRKDGTNPRANGRAPRDEGVNPRAQGTSPRQEREALRRGGIPMTTAQILARAAAAGRPEEG